MTHLTRNRVVRLCEVEGLSYSAAASELGMTRAQVAGLMFRHNHKGMKRGDRFGRKRGEDAPRAVLTESKVRKMREERKAGDLLSALSERYGVTVPTVQKIVNGELWAHV